MKRRLCSFLVFALCVACLTGAAMAGEESIHTDYVTISEDGFVADSMDGVAAIYNLTTGSPDCLEYIQRYYRERYGLEVQAIGHNIWISNNDSCRFEQTDTPQPGDIGYASAEERGTSGGHYVMCKQADPAAGTITLIEQNWIWAGQAGVNRTISYTGSCYTFYTLVSGAGGRPQPQEPTYEENEDAREATNGVLPSAPLSAVGGAAAGAGVRSASEVLGVGAMNGTVSDWAKSAVSRAQQWGISAGTSLNANAAITRGQFARLLVNTAYALGYDVDLSQPQSESARLALMMGDDRGNFDAEGTLTREMAAVVLARLWQLTGDALAADESVLSRYPDAAAISAWAREGTAMATAAGLIDGTGTGFAPKGALTCEQAVTLLARLAAARMYMSL